MPPLRSAAALLLVAIVLGAAGCGGSSGPSQEDRQSEQRWRSGFGRWGNDMVAALNGISVLFSNPSFVDRLQRGDARTSARLATYERRLDTCGSRVRALGDAPEALAQAREDALRACVLLERGSRQVRRGVTEWQGGRGIDGIDAATNTLGVAQDEIQRARGALGSAPDE